MQENTNKSLAVNTLALYIRLLVTAICGLFTTRFALEALGVVDYGLFSVIGSIISFIAIINTIMVSTSNRFIAVAIGKRDVGEANKQFNVCLIIHIVISFCTILFALPIGEWYTYHYLNYAGDITNALMVFRFTIIASAVTFIGVPYNGLLSAKEKFIVFCVPDIISHILKLVVAYLIVSYFENKLMIYSLSIAIFTAYPVVVYIIYCRKNYHEISHITFIRDKKCYKEIIIFSAWVTYGAIAYVGKAQGAAILVNAFFSTVMNTALGIANAINGIIVNFAQNVAQPIAPQITKSYAAGDKDRSNYLLVLSTKLTFLTMFLVSSPFLVGTEWILQLWLGQVPDYAAMFTILVIVDALIDSLNSGIKNIIFASGRIKMFQIASSTLKMCAIVAAFIVLKIGAPAYSLLYAYIFFTVLVFFANQWVLNKTLNYDNAYLWKKSYIPSFLVVGLFCPCFFLKLLIPQFVAIVLSILYLCILILLVGLTKQERNYLYSIVSKKITK